MTAEEMKSWLAVILGALALLGHLKGYFSSGEKKLENDLKEAKIDIEEVGDRLDDHERRVQALENEMRHLPDRESQYRIEKQLVEVSGRIDVLAESLKPIKANNELITELLKMQATK
jgi:hypothetical protein